MDNTNTPIYNVIIKRRSIRRFTQKPISQEHLEKMVNAARLAPSAANLQPLEFIIINQKNICDEIFKTISWAGYIKPPWTPEKKERPTAYIAILIRDIENSWCIRDTSYAASNIVLTAMGFDIGSCIVCKIKKEKIKEILAIPKKIEVDSLIALGYKAEEPVVEDYVDTVKYWRDDEGILHVPKRKMEKIMHLNKYDYKVK